MSRAAWHLHRRAGAADDPGVITQTLTFAAARSRAHGPTTALWHAVEVHRAPADLDGACELTVCGTLARVTTEAHWPVSGVDVCSACTAAS
ncbi:hypothetical protein O2W15_05390 [Modestobacter sp. VKM Ac-2979]|uniref:hypothetical protein n=1 Tax=unclassified Modestobacter TaxID=2643866 RepID=UPI0022AB8C8B|nr:MULTISPECIES: hypothetical protein [unclassified Modestobacter]MCZ2810863.1 hypothetical protein [Modestobacter sp. VKM Ac-2979]MCZ2840376.1 hypothetical protein [Modestobacter sp. VKM Ac-2980]